MADGKRGVNDPGVAWPVRPQTIVCGGRSRPAVSMSDEAREQRPRPADLPEPAGAVSVWQDVINADGLTAITSGSMRTRRVAVQGSALRSDRALCARLARVRVRPGRLWSSVSARP